MTENEPTIMNEVKLSVPAILSEVAVACGFVVEAARQAGLDERAVYHCDLAVDEVCTNIIEHGYSGAADDQVMEIICRRGERQLEVIILDDSPQFNPLVQEDPDPQTPIEDRKKGGWGVFIVKRVMDDVLYDYDSGRNRLTLVVRGTKSRWQDRPSSLTQNHIAIERLDDAAWVVNISGRFGTGFSPYVNKFMLHQIELGRHNLALDMSELDFISSAGVKTLVSLWKAFASVGGRLVLIAPSTRTALVLETVGLDTVIEVLPDYDAFLRQLPAE